MTCVSKVKAKYIIYSLKDFNALKIVLEDYMLLWGNYDFYILKLWWNHWSVSEEKINMWETITNLSVSVHMDL